MFFSSQKIVIEQKIKLHLLIKTRSVTWWDFFSFSQVTSWPAWEPDNQPAVRHPVPHQPAPAIGDFVEAEVKGRYRNVNFFAKFLDVDKSQWRPQVTLNYLTVKPGSADIFVWVDESWLPKEQITKTVHPPVPLSGFCLVLLLFLSSFFYKWLILLFPPENSQIFFVKGWAFL